MQRLLFIGIREGASVIPALAEAGYRCLGTPPEEGPLRHAFEAHNPDGLVLELTDDLLLLQHVRRVMRDAFNERPLPLFALARRTHLNPPHLAVGVDDFLVAPYHPDELIARIQMLFWRFQRAEAGNCLNAGDLTLDMARHTVTVAGKPAHLTLREYQLLQFLMAHRGRAFTRESLLAQVWGYHFEGDVRVVDAYVKRVRGRLPAPHSQMVETVRGVGYRFNPNSSESHMPNRPFVG